MTRRHPTPVTPETAARRRRDDDRLAAGLVQVLSRVRYVQANRPGLMPRSVATDDEAAEGVLLVLRAINAHVNGDSPITAAAS